ncbi:MAG: ATP-binding cassette domain-containing protein [Alphaproteobacteria bacterium]|nr:ATP-binding cassette domain-containing protein [Alphaproteobacteria bacterium]
MAHALELHDVHIAVGGRALIDHLDLVVSPGTVTTVMGESGAGKSSLLAFLCGTLSPAFAASGRVVAGGVDVSADPPERRRIGILFQDDLLFPHMSVGQNLAFGLPRSIDDWRTRSRLIADGLAEVGLAGFGDRDPATLSGGQRARVAVIRVMLSQPRALLLDEPFSKLDAATKGRFRPFVFDHVRKRSIPTLLVTHDPQDALAAAGPVIHLGSIDGAPA